MVEDNIEEDELSFLEPTSSGSDKGGGDDKETVTTDESSVVDTNEGIASRKKTIDIKIKVILLAVLLLIVLTGILLIVISSRDRDTANSYMYEDVTKEPTIPEATNLSDASTMQVIAASLVPVAHADAPNTTVHSVHNIMPQQQQQQQQIIYPQKHPTQNTLQWETNCNDAFNLDLTNEQMERLTGGCAKLTFCNRRGDSLSYLNGKYGYAMGDGGECLSPGPIMRMYPGKTYGIIHCVVDGVGHPGSNLHTHGPHIPGSGNSDDISRITYQNSCGFYEYPIPSDHMGGTNWYHPHLHPYAENQTSGGAFGLLIIEDQVDQDLVVDPSSGGTAGERAQVYDFLTDSTRELFLLAAFDIHERKWLNKNQDGNSKTYNLIAGVWYRMKIATINANAEPESIDIPSGCHSYALAYDGVYKFEPPREKIERYYLTGASRMDIALKCDIIGIFNITISAGWLSEEQREDDPWSDGGSSGSDNIDSSSWSDGGGSPGSQSIAKLIVSTGTVPNGNTGPFLNLNGGIWKSYRPNYLKDLRTATVQNTWDIDIGIEDINGKEYDEQCSLKDFEYGAVQEWLLKSVSQHPVHVHMYHQQVVSDCGAGHEIGEYYDTVADASDLSPSSECKVRFKMIDFGGRVVLHCHILRHEDAGAMAWINVKGSPYVSPIEPCCISGTCSACVDENNLPDDCDDDDDRGAPTYLPTYL